MNKKLIYIILILIGLTSYAQEYKYISGVVFDKENEHPVKNVNIIILNSKLGASTDTRGVFYIKVEKLPVKIAISHVAYNDTVVEIKKYNTELIEIALIKSKNIINEVSVFANKKVIELTKKKFFDLNDFEFMGDSLVLLAYDWQEKQNPWLILMNNNGDTLAKTAVNIDGKFYKDCLGNIHLLSDVKAYQINFNGKEFELLFPVKTKQFVELMKPCVQSLNNKLYIQQYSYKNQILSYYCSDVKDSTSKEMRVIADWVGARNVYDMQTGHYSVKLATDADIRFEEMCFFDPIYAPMVKVNDTICILNFIENKIEFFNIENRLINEVAIEFHKKQHWKEQVFVDNITGKIYSVFKKRGNTTLKEIDKKTGKLISSIDIPKFRFIEKIIVHNGTIYFMYRKNTSMELMRLFKLDL